MPSRSRLTLANLDRRSTLVMCGQLALGAGAMFALGGGIGLLIGNPPFFPASVFPNQIAGIGALALSMAFATFLFNVAGASFIRLLHWLRWRFLQRR